ncbi:glycoside hydrolase family 55 protein [Cohnella sp. REN36]|uniref:glycoside hydrolase family 55 protein n=1 Tax=Cohnella sp. REN36 TaxID=2887347 RepID=UPI001D13DDE2|nr:glycoside hydrolase family 55 protein [Cohnella sp. REN36]
MKKKISWIMAVVLCMEMIYSGFLILPGATPQAAAAPMGDVLKLTVVNDATDTGNYDKYVRVKLSVASTTIASGDYLEYDVKLDGAPNSAGAVDIKFTDGSWLSDASGYYDQNGIGGSATNSIKNAANQWYHRKLKLPASVVGKTIESWSLYGHNSIPNDVYSAYYDNVTLTNGSGTVKLTAYGNGPIPFQNVLNSNGIAAVKFEGLQASFTKGLPSGDVLHYKVTNNSTTGTNKYSYLKFSNAGANSYVFTASDYIEYDVLLNDSLAYGAGGIDIVNTDGTAFRDAAGWMDQLGNGGHPSTDISRYAAGTWLHRKLQVPSSMVGKTISYWMLGGENDDANTSYLAIYDNVIVTNGSGTTKLSAYADGAPSLNVSALTSNATGTLTAVSYADATGSPSGDVLGFTTQMAAEPDFTPFGSYSNKYSYWAFSDQAYTIQSDDYFEYDVSHIDFTYRPGFAADLQFTDGSTLRDSGAYDQHGLSAHPSTDLLRYTANRWYHRKIKIPASLVGKTVSKWIVANETNMGNDFTTGYLDNVTITNGSGTVRATGYSGGNPAINQEMYRNNAIFALMAKEPLAGYAAGTPAVVTTTFPTEDVPIASYNVMNFGAVRDGTTDDTVAFQQALFAADQNGGGVVFAPAGQYAIKGHLYIPLGVTLRGDWKNPDSGGLGQGTILKAYENKGNENGVSFISMYGSSALTNVSIWYPEQSMSNVQAFPWTIQVLFHDNAAVENVTLVNSYNGIKLGPNWNELEYIHNVYGTILHKGIEQGFISDVSRIENVKFKPDYWSASGLAGSPSSPADLTALKNYMVANAEGLRIGRVDFGNVYDVTLRSFKIGVNLAFEFSSYGGQAGGTVNMAKLDIAEGNIGVLADYANVSGYTISDSSIKASSGTNPIAVKVTPHYANYLGISNSVVGGSPQTAVLKEGTGTISLQNVTFDDWGYSGGTYAIEAKDGSLSVAGSTFSKNAKAILLASGLKSATVMGNSFNGSPQIDNTSGLNSTYLQIDHTGFSFDARSYSSHIYRPSMPKPPNSNFYNIKSSPYNAVGDGTTDDMSAIQNALNAASSAGGGTVYVPPSKYLVSGTLSVPSNVELRGVFDTAHHTLAEGSVLFSTAGKGNASGTPFITLAANSGVRGLTIHYPEQDYTNISAYPWAIRSNGSNDYVINVTFSNAYQGIDFGLTNNADNHYISGVHGTFLKQGIYAGKSPTEGWLENIHMNPHYWFRSPFIGSPQGDWFSTIYQYMMQNLGSFTLGETGNEHALSLFTFGGDTGFRTEAQGTGKTNAIVYLPGLDSQRMGVQVDESGTKGVDMIGGIFYTGGTDSTRGYVYVGSSHSGTFRLFNSLGGDPNSKPVAPFELWGGTSVIQQYYLPGPGSDRNFKLYGGGGRIDNIVSPIITSSDAYVASGIASARFIGGTYKGGFDIVNQAGASVTVTGNVSR